MNRVSPVLVLALLASVAFTLATGLELRVGHWTDRSRTDSPVKRLLGDGRKLFANQFIVMADVYLHSGYYPSIFDRKEPVATEPTEPAKATEHDPANCSHEHHNHAPAGQDAQAGHEHHAHDAHGNCLDGDDHERAMSFLESPRNWVDGFIRRFRITEHTHLEGGQEREMLPWLKLAIETDPHKVDTYVTTAYWLRSKLRRADEAEHVLREGLRLNPESPDLLFEMGVLYEENRQDPERARNLWKAALRRWEAQPAEVREANALRLGHITTRLARLEATAGNWVEAIRYYELAKRVSPQPDKLEDRIEELRVKARAEAVSGKPVP